MNQHDIYPLPRQFDITEKSDCSEIVLIQAALQGENQLQCDDSITVYYWIERGVKYGPGDGEVFAYVSLTMLNLVRITQPFSIFKGLEPEGRMVQGSVIFNSYSHY
ncbi:hypothetical protein RF11_14947 [Thelohanellus kitauei]|uniref:Uncharacterized protein n=1 Tax=Thelohanellus kitauei TaxID=669202 RepID=A0A0C2NA46_THEKT|nr:hypothetical protein RF11_14947 [Thelohanellus kitauei]